MNIVVTGGLGFIGSHVIDVLLQQTDATIHCLDSETYAANLVYKDTAAHNKRLTFHKVDISRNDQIQHVSACLNNVDYVIHLAAESHVDNSIHGPELFVLTNVLGTFNMLEFARHKGVKRFVHVSTDEVYGSIDAIDGVAFTEETLLDPSSVYSSTKASSDLLVKSYWKTYGLDVCITRCCNNYGPRQNKEKLLPKLISNAVTNQPIPVYGNGKNMREWIYVVDHCKAILSVLQQGEPGEVYNIGTSCVVSNIDLVERVLNMLGKNKDLVAFVEDRLGHDFIYKINCDKIKTQLGWRHTVDLFDEGLDLTIDYYKKVL